MTFSAVLNPGSLLFGTVFVGETSSSQSLFVSNSGDADLNISSVEVNGVNRFEFDIDIDLCSGAIIVPGGTCAIELRFIPNRDEFRTAALAVTTDAMPSLQEIGLGGVGAYVTTTIATGFDPPNTVACPGGQATPADIFSLISNHGDDPVSYATVNLSPGTTEALASVEITDSAGATVFGAAAPSQSEDRVVIDLNLTSTEVLTEYLIRLVPKSHADLPPPPGRFYDVSARLNLLGNENLTAGADTTTTIVTIDNLSPASPVLEPVVIGDQQLIFTWTNPADSDLAEISVIRGEATISGAPVEGATLAVGDAISGGTVVFTGLAASFVDTGLTNGTDYWYAVHARDNCGNFSLAAATGPHSPNSSASTITIGNGVEPENSLVCPGSAAVALDAFSLVLDTGTDTVTAVELTLSSGSAVHLEMVEITGASGATSYGLLLEPAGDIVTIPITPALTVDTTEQEFMVWVTPLDHSSMPAPPGIEMDVDGVVSRVTAASGLVLGDLTSATVTIDNQAPDEGTWIRTSSTQTDVLLNWTAPVDPDHQGFVILRGVDTAPVDRPEDGTALNVGDLVGSSQVVYVGPGTSTIDSAVSPNVVYVYRLFTTDQCGNLSPAGVASQAVTLAAGAIPTLGEIGIILLTFLIAIAGILILQRRLQ